MKKYLKENKKEFMNLGADVGKTIGSGLSAVGRGINSLSKSGVMQSVGSAADKGIGLVGKSVTALGNAAVNNPLTTAGIATGAGIAYLLRKKLSGNYY